MPWIPLAVAAVQGGIGVAQMIQANKAKKRATLPTSEDSRVNQYEAELNQTRSNLRTGTAYRSFIDSLDEERKELTEEAFGRTGGYYGAAITAADRIAKQYGSSLSKFGMNAFDTGITYDQLVGRQVERGAERRFTLDQQEYLQNQVDYTQNKQAGMSNLLGALESVAGANFGSKKTSPETIEKLMADTAYDAAPELNDAIPSAPAPAMDFSLEPFGKIGYPETDPYKFGDSFLKQKKYTLSY